MNVLQRYLLGEIIRSALGATLLFVFLLLAGNALKDIAALLAAGQLTVSLFLRLLGLLLPYVFAYALPLGLLTAILLVLGRMSARNEITALQSAGLSLWQITSPVMLAAVLGTTFAVVINTVWAPDARASYRELLRDVVREDPLRFLVPKTFIADFSGYVVYFEEEGERSVENLWIWELNEGGAAVRLLRAESGRISYADNEDALILSLRNAAAEIRDEDEPNNLREYQPAPSFEDLRLRLDLVNLLGARLAREKVSHLSLPILIQRKAQARAEIGPEAPAATRPESDLESPLRYTIQMQKLFSSAFGVISLALVGIPLAIRTGRAETYANAALALGLGLVFYTLGIFTSWAEPYPTLRPELLVWIPNLVFQALGLFLLARRERV